MTTPPLKKWRGRAGDVFAVEVAPKMFAFGQICATKDVAFFEIRSDGALPIEAIVSAPVLFRIPMARGGTTGRSWFYLGNATPLGELAGYATYRVQSVGSNRIFLIQSGLAGEPQVEVSKEQAKQYEPMAWWFCEHIEERLLDWYLKRPSRIVSAMHRIYDYDSSGQLVRESAVHPAFQRTPNGAAEVER